MQGKRLIIVGIVLMLPACSAGVGTQDASSPAVSAIPPTASSPSTSVSSAAVSAPPQAQRTALDFEDLNKKLACFELGTYQGAKRDSDPKASEYASKVQKTASEIRDPQWAEVATFPADEAMKRLAALCKAGHYQQ